MHEEEQLTTLVWPEILDGSEKTCFGMNGYRDKLCSLIEKLVSAARMEQDETISLIFKMISRCEYRSGPMKVKESGQFSPVPSITSSSSRLRS